MEIEKNTKKIDRIYICEIFFLMGYTLYLFYYIICTLSNFGIIINTELKQLLHITWMGIFFVKILFLDKHILKEWTSIVGILALLTSSIFISRDIRFFEMVLIIVAAKHVSIKKIINLTLVLLITFVSVVIISSQIGIIDNYTFYDTSYRERKALGFVYVSQLPFFVREIIFILLIKAKKRKIIIIAILAIIITYIVYRFTGVRNLLLTSIILVLLILVNEYKSKIFETFVVKKMIIYSFIIGLTLSLLLTISYDSSRLFYRKLNEKLSNRPMIQHMMFNKYGISVLGKKINMYGVSAITNNKKLTFEDYSYIDNLYTQILLKDGILILIMFIIVLTILIDKCFKKREYIIIGIWFFVIAISSVIDDEVMYICYNFPMIFLTHIFYDTNKRAEKRLAIDKRRHIGRNI